MKRKLIFTIMALVCAVSVHAQLSFGVYSHDEVLHAMSDYALANKSLSDLRLQYDAELRRVEDEFNKKYELFLEGQRDFAPTILQKRQAELQELMRKNVAFKEEARRLMLKAEEDAYQPLNERILLAVRQLGMERGYAFIMNTDDGAITFINPDMGTDVTQDLKSMLP